MEIWGLLMAFAVGILASTIYQHYGLHSFIIDAISSSPESTGECTTPLVGALQECNPSYFDRPKIVVTGGAGYVGSHTVLELLTDKRTQKFDIIVVDNLESGHTEAIGGAKFQKLDLGDKDGVMKFFMETKPLAVIDFAAYLAVEQSQRYPMEYMRNNIINFQNILEAMKNCSSEGKKIPGYDVFPCQIIVKSSTQATYGDVPDEHIPISEQYTETHINAEPALSEGYIGDTMATGSALFHHFIGHYSKFVADESSFELQFTERDMEKLKTPKSVYGLSKLINEMMMEKAEKAFGLRWISLRYGNVCGADPEGRIGEAKPKPHTLMTLAIYSIMARQGFFNSITTGQKFHKVLKVFGTDYPTEDGTAVRDYVHPTDLATAHLSSFFQLLANNEVDSRVFNLGTNVGSSVFDVLEAVKTAAGEAVEYTLEGRRPGDTARSVLDCSLAERGLGWKAKYTLIDMAKTAWEWHVAHPKGFQES